MKFNDISKDYITVMRGRDRPFFADIQDERNLLVPLFIKHADFSDLERKKEEIAHWFKHNEPKKLEFTDDPDRIYFATVIDIDTLETHRLGTDIVVQFQADNKYSQERTITATGTHNIKGHKSTFWRTETEFTANQTGYELQFNSPGKTALRDICKIKLNYQFKSGDRLICDYKKRKITVNNKDITNSLVIMQSNFMELPVGQNVEFQSSSETKIFYHERYY